MPMFDIRRRDFIALLTCSVTTSPLAARAQEPGKVKRIGFLRVYAACHGLLTHPCRSRYLPVMAHSPIKMSVIR